MGFRLVPKSVTLNDLKRRNGHYFALFPNVVAFLANYVKAVISHQQNFSREMS